MTGVCALCGRVGRVESHHPTRRPGRGEPYFDDRFTVALCVTCHAAVHQVLRVDALDWPAPGAVQLAYRLRTTATHVAVFAAQGSAFPIVPSAASAVGALLREAAAAVDAVSSTRAGAA